MISLSPFFLRLTRVESIYDSERLKLYLRPFSESGETVTKEMIEAFFVKEKEAMAERR